MSLTANQVQALRELDQVWPAADKVIIGATALGFYYDMRWRQTADVDLAIALELDDFPGDLLDRPGWTRHSTKEHEFTSPAGVRVDLLPAGNELLAAGHLTWPGGQVMSLAGMDLAFAHAESHDALDDYIVRTAPPPVVVALKMAAYCDRPTERERDLADIAHLLDIYVDDDNDRRWEDAAGKEFELAPAYLLGLDVGRIATQTAHKRLIERFLSLVEDPESTGYAVMQRRAPNHWHADDGLTDRLAAFRDGMSAG